MDGADACRYPIVSALTSAPPTIAEALRNLFPAPARSDADAEQTNLPNTIDVFERHSKEPPSQDSKTEVMSATVKEVSDDLMVRC
jgi:hypothetical protein